MRYAIGSFSTVYAAVDSFLISTEEKFHNSRKLPHGYRLLASFHDIIPITIYGMEENCHHPRTAEKGNLLY